jgi:hypothetical protein
VEQAAKRRKRRKKEDSSDEAARAAALAYPAQRILLDLELWGAKIDHQAVLNARRTQLAKDLGHLFARQGLGCFQPDIVDSSLFAPLAPFRGRDGKTDPPRLAC